jgi:hypothetical protein
MTGRDEVRHVTRAEVLEAAKLGLSRAEYEDLQARRARRSAVVPRERITRSRRPGNVVEISEDEYQALSVAAALARRFVPAIERTAWPVTHQSEFAGLVEVLQDIEIHQWGGSFGDSAAVGDLLHILDDTRS